MKKIFFIILSLAIAMNNYGNNQENKLQAKMNTSKKILIACYSWSGNTQKIAEQIQTISCGDIFEIVPVKPYPADYDKCVEQAKKEINSGFKPALSKKVENIEKYDIIFIGTPNWWSTLAPPVATFLSEYNLSGKTVIPFCTHGGGREANIFTDIKKLVPNSNWKEGFAISGSRANSAKEDVKKWLQKIEVIE
jgi:flavodoxin